MGVIAKGISRSCQGLFIPVSSGYTLSVFNKSSTLQEMENTDPTSLLFRFAELLAHKLPNLSSFVELSVFFHFLWVWGLGVA